MKALLLSAVAVALVTLSPLHAQNAKWQKSARAAILKYVRTLTAEESRESVRGGTGKRSFSEDGLNVKVTDLDGDGDPDAVADFFTEGLGSGSGLGHTVICLNEKGGPRVALHLYDGDLSDLLHSSGVREIGNSRTGIRLDSVDGSHLSFITYDYHADDAMCCPSIQGTVELVYTDGGLSFSKVLVPARRVEQAQ